MLSPWYITGFCDAEAAFTYSRSGGTFGLYFAIKEREDSRQIIEDIHAYFHYAGYIYKGKGTTTAKNSSGTKSYTYYRVTKVQELRTIIGHFDKYPLQNIKKREAYHVWRQMVLHKLENYRSINYEKLRTLAARLSSLNIQSRALKVHSR